MPSVRIHHLNCGTMRPAWQRPSKQAGQLVCHCLLIESEEGLILVDTGIGERLATKSRGESFQLIKPLYQPAETALSQILGLGYQREDVRHVILTHLDMDHAGGLREFPDAQVHIFGPELRAALEPADMSERLRYRQAQWAHDVDWVSHELTGGDQWFGFESVRSMSKISDDVLLIPLAGHTRGHIGVAVRSADGDDRQPEWLLHAGDAYFSRGEIEASSPKPARWLMGFVSMVQFDKKARHANRLRLSELVSSQSGQVSIFSSHDAAEFHHMVSAGSKMHADS